MQLFRLSDVDKDTLVIVVAFAGVIATALLVYAVGGIV